MPPEVHQYRSALERLWSRSGVTDKQRQMLLEHCRHGTMTARELGRAVEYPWQAVNGQYGRLGALLGEEMGWNFKPGELKSSVIARFTARTDGSDVRWHMHDQLARAIREFASERGLW